MRLRIHGSSWFEKRYLEVEPAGVRFLEGAVLGTAQRRFKFAEIAHVLMSAKNELCFQVGLEVFRVRFKPRKKKHQAALAALLEGVRQAP